jgi:hypothetical protein
MMASDFFPSKHGDFGAYFPKEKTLVGSPMIHQTPFEI